MKKVFIFICSCALFAACDKSKNENINLEERGTKVEVIDEHSAEFAIDYEGTYNGVLPAADCPGIETTLTLNPDKTFNLHSVYIDKNASFDEKGTYTVKESLLTLKEKSGEESYYKVEENRLRQLDMDKKEIKGELAEQYVLKKSK